MPRIDPFDNLATTSQKLGDRVAGASEADDQIWAFGKLRAKLPGWRR
jgi:hypothetical protein